MCHSCHGVSTGQHKTTEYAAHQCVGGIDTVFKSLNVMRGGIEAEQQSLGTHYQPFVSLKYMWCTLNVQGGELCTQQTKLRVEFVKGTIAGYARIGFGHTCAVGKRSSTSIASSGIYHEQKD